MTKKTNPLPDMLEVVRADCTLVMDCNSGIALLSIRPRRDDAAPGEEGSARLAARPKTKLSQN